MTRATIYHNPKCSKSRQALNILKDQGIDPLVIEYLKTPPSLETIKKLCAHFDLKDFIRHNEAVFRTLHLDFDDEARILEVLLKEPILMQRPIVAYGDFAIIARPPEKVLELITKIRIHR